MKLARSLAIVVMLALGGMAHADSEQEFPSSGGLSPAQAAAWMDAQMHHADTVKQFGEDSPEATGSQVMLNTLARSLGMRKVTNVPIATVETSTSSLKDTAKADTPVITVKQASGDLSARAMIDENRRPPIEVSSSAPATDPAVPSEAAASEPAPSTAP